MSRQRRILVFVSSPRLHLASCGFIATGVLIFSLVMLFAPSPWASERQHTEPRYYLNVGFAATSKVGDQAHLRAVREALVKGLRSLPEVTLSIGDNTPTALSRQRLKGFHIDGSLQRLSTTRIGNRQKIDCELQAIVSSWPEQSIKLITTEGAAVELVGAPDNDPSGQHDCLMATVDALRDAIQTYLQTVH